jgi:hypothetical protein
MILLGLEPGRPSYEIDRFGDPRTDVQTAIRVQTRSVLGAMAYLSHAVAVPEAHTKTGLIVRSPRTERVIGDLLAVKVAPDLPPSAAAAVQYRGYWYYVDDRDQNSKRTLGLLHSLMRLEISAGGSQNIPILTLPVGR